jgi:hypothetical protein
MSIIRRSDSLSVDHYIEHLEKHGLTPTGIRLQSDPSAKNVTAYNAGDAAEMPSFYNRGIALNLTSPDLAKRQDNVDRQANSASTKFVRVAADN